MIGRIEDIILLPDGRVRLDYTEEDSMHQPGWSGNSLIASPEAIQEEIAKIELDPDMKRKLLGLIIGVAVKPIIRVEVSPVIEAKPDPKAELTVLR
jgi:hypothetical protein